VKRDASRIRFAEPPPWTALASGVELRRLVEGNGASIDLYRLAPGCRFAEHSHSFTEFSVMLSGEGRLIVEGDEKPIGPGDSFFIPGGTLHGFVAGDDAPVVMMNVTAPLPADLEVPPSSEALRIARLTAQGGSGTSKAPSASAQALPR